MRRDANALIVARDVKANGLTFRVRTCGYGGRLALCLHGFPEGGLAWTSYMPFLARLGYRAWAPDLRGYGGTTKPEGIEAYAMETLVDDVAALIDASGCTSVTIIAHDWGAVLAWIFAARGVRQLEKLVIMNVPHPMRFAAALRGPEQLVRSWYALFFQLPWLPERLLSMRDGGILEAIVLNSSAAPSRFPADIRAMYRENGATPASVAAMLAWYRAAIGRGGMARLVRAGLPRIEVPTLLLWGERDIALAKSTTDRTSDHVADLTVRYFPNASHFLHYEIADEVTVELQRFLADHH